MKLEVIFDEEKIKSEGKYTVNQIIKKWNELFYENNIYIKDESGNFIGDDKENFEDFAKIIIAIKLTFASVNATRATFKNPYKGLPSIFIKI